MPDTKKTVNAGRVLSGENASFLGDIKGKLKELGDSLDGFLSKAGPPEPPTGDGKKVPLEVPKVTVDETTVSSGQIDDVTKKFVEGVDDVTLGNIVRPLDGLDLSMVPEPLKKLLATAKKEVSTRATRTKVENDEEETIMRVFDILCCHGNRHQKRGHGIKSFPQDMLFRCFPILDLVDFINGMFKRRLELERSLEENLLHTENEVRSVLTIIFQKIQEK